jgi:hypothetical protein
MSYIPPQAPLGIWVSTHCIPVYEFVEKLAQSNYELIYWIFITILSVRVIININNKRVMIAQDHSPDIQLETRTGALLIKCCLIPYLQPIYM